MFDLSFFEKLHSGRLAYGFVGCFLIAFVTSLTPISAYENHGILIAAIILGALILFELCNRNERPRMRRDAFIVNGLVAGLSLLALVSIVFSDIPYTSILFGGIFFLMPMSFFVFSRSNDARFIQATLVGVAVILIFLSFTTLLQYYFITPYLEDGRINWPMKNPNILAGLFSFGFLGGLATVLRTKSYWAAAFCVLIFTAMLASSGRGALYATVISSALLLFLLRDVTRERIALLVVIALSCVASFFLLNFNIQSSAQSPAESFSFTNIALLERWEMWQSAFNIFKDFPFTGTGIGTFLMYYHEYRLQDYYSAGYMAHNDILQFATEMGFIAPLLIYALAITIVTITWQTLQRIQSSDPRRFVIAASFCALLSCFAQAHISFHFHMPSTMIMTGLALGLWLNAVTSSATPQSEPYIVPDLYRMGGAFVLVLMITLFSACVISQIYTKHAQNAFKKGDEITFLQYVSRARQISGDQNAHILLLQAEYELNKAIQSSLTSAQKMQVFARIDDMAKQAIATNPRQAYAYHLRAKALAKMNKGGQEALLKQALTINPELLETRIDLAKLYERQGRADAALRTLKQGTKRRHGHMNALPYYIYLAELSKKMNDIETMNEAIELANGFHARVRKNLKQRRDLQNLLSKVWIK